ncbi:MAG: glycosyltransferase family 39 protein [Limisphaerales bacterium]
MGKSLYRPQHLGTALEYAHTPINLLKPVIWGFNANETPTLQELPVWQAAAGLVFKILGSTWYGWANLVSLIFFATALWPFFQLARQYVGQRAAWWTLAFFLAQPLIVIYAGRAATDGFCLVVVIWFLFFADRMIQTGQLRWWLPLVLFACLGAVSKLPFFMVAGLVAVSMLIVKRERSLRLWALLAGAGAVAAVVFMGWSHYCDSMAALAEYPYTELRLSRNPFMVWWFFGDLQMRLSPGIWIKGSWRFLDATLGSLPFAVILLAALIRPETGSRSSGCWPLF